MVEGMKGWEQAGAKSRGNRKAEAQTSGLLAREG